jgi:ribosome-associated protein YbcJ (S4-like RNA binding protein)
MRSSPRVPITTLAQQKVAGVVRPGDIVWDATAGNGHDTVWLAELVTESGHVFSVDIQKAAIEATRQRLQAAGYTHVTLTQQSHGVPLSQQPGTVSAVMFNLGYHPGGDKSVVTKTAETLRGLRQAERLLTPGGIMTIIAYRGHAGGEEEELAVRAWFEQLLSTEYQKTRSQSDAANPTAPVLYVIRKEPVTNEAKDPMTEQTSPEDTIALDRFLKLAQIVSSGGEAKHLIRSGVVQVNGESETRRGRKLRHGDTVTANGEDYVIQSDTAETPPENPSE